LDENFKIQILISGLQERYNAAHKIRERGAQFTLWLSGMAVGLCWLLITHQNLQFFQKIALTLLILTLFCGSLVVLWGLMKGMKNNRNTLIKHERALKMYKKGVYLPDESLLPETYGKIKTKWTDHFCTLCIWLVVLAFSLILLTWSCP
jgi:protein-S-isoprenylcysteine O-methyltransferase Ste14